MIVCLCGTTRYRAGFERANKELTQAGIVVLTVGWFAHTDEQKPDRAQKSLLDALHFRKISMADAILVVDVNFIDAGAGCGTWHHGHDGYIGESTEREIAWARLNGKHEFYVSQEGLRRLIESHGTRMDSEHSRNRTDPATAAGGSLR